MKRIDLSVVIGFRDWGADRLRRSVASLLAATGELDAEIIISDYGSTDPSISRAIADDAGIRWVHTPREPAWSRSRALNVGFAIARGELLVSTDADMLFSPGSLQVVHAEAVAAAPCAVFLQCRDLPESLDDLRSSETEDVSWHLLEKSSRLRPRWGMGGMMAIDREGFARLHGFDERLHTYGREDLDFALRARRAGWRTHWVQDPRARMYHMWHPPTSDTMQSTAGGRQAITRNRRIVDSDATTARNQTTSTPLLENGRPLVSIVVTEASTVEELHRTVATALAQSVRDIEVLVAATELGAKVVADFADSRVRCIREWENQDPLGALPHARGVHVSIVRSGDMLPLRRTETLLSALTEGYAGTLGGLAVARDDGTLETGRPTGDITDGLLMIRESMDVLLTIGGASLIISGSIPDALRRAGIAIAMSEDPSTLTIRDQAIEHPEMEATSESLVSELRALLPAHHSAAAPRRATLSAVPAESLPIAFDGTASLTGVRHRETSLSGGLVVDDASYADLAAMAQSGHLVEVTETARHPDQLPGRESSWIETVLEHAVSHGLELPIALRRTPDPISAGECVGGYTVHDGRHTFGVLVAPDDPSPGVVPWLIIGCTIEEIWA